MPSTRRSTHVKKADIARSSELTDAAGTVASLALAKVRQNGTLGLRQGQQLRRALATVGDTLGWDSMPGSRADRVEAATRDVAKLAEAGAQLLEHDVADLLIAKKGEMQQIERAARSLHELAADSAVAYPTEVTYSRTMRNGIGGLVTKVETLTLNNAAEALNAATTLEKRMGGLEKLRDQMLQDLHDRQREVKVMKKGLSGFVESSKSVVRELIAMAT